MKKFSILFLANSFADDTIQYMPEIAKEVGYDLDMYNLYIGGCDINRHIKNILNNEKAYELRIYNPKTQLWETKYDVSSNEFIASQRWDYIVLQQSSYFSGLPHGLDNIEELVRLIKGLANEDVKFIWNMTWSYPHYSDLEVFAKEYRSDPKYMYQSIVDNVEEYIVPNSDFVKIIPNGTALGNVREYVEDRLLYRDGFHLSYQFGRFLAGLTAIAAITEKDISKVKFHPVEIDDATIEIYKECVKRAIANPLEITER